MLARARRCPNVNRIKHVLTETVHPVVFPVSALLIVGVVVFTAVATDTASAVFGNTQDFVQDTFGWFLIITVALLLGVAIYLALSPYGRIKLGPDDSTPDYSTGSWFAMLFSAGMGIGLVFWGVAEPIFIAGAPPRAEPGTAEASQEAMNFVFHHWGLSPWAIYAIIGLGLAYFGFRKDLPMTMRSLFKPLLGDKVDGPIGHVVDILAVVATVFGIATSLGLGATQVAAGLDRVFGWEAGGGGMLAIIAVITGLATISVISGLDKGIKILSQTNIIAATALAVFVALVGPTLLLLFAFVENTGNYVQNIFNTLAFTGTYAGDAADSFLGDWTIFYWAWWISWSPFVGMFIARVSRGRTIREFILGVLLAPTLASFAWFTIFGNTALGLDGVIDEVNELGEDVGMFALIENLGLPSGVVTGVSLLVIFIVVVFFVTSSDSGSFVVDMLTSGGDLDPAVETRVFWSVTEGAVAAALLFAGGDAALEGLQAGAVSAGFPFAIVLLFATWSLLKGLRQEKHAMRRERAGPPPFTVEDATRRERERRQAELAQKAKELDLRERELDLRERELDLTDPGGAGPP
ncbi:BCCT family transporter [Nitriliruptoraceae bacterium ZYF776]|nr:BCCT family transporter [Profundirhabdus halotolerans]